MIVAALFAAAAVAVALPGTTRALPRSGPAGRRRAVDRRPRVRLPSPLLLELLAALLESGAAPSSAVRSVGVVLAADGDPRGPALLDLAVRLDQGMPPSDPGAAPRGSRSRPGGRTGSPSPRAGPPAESGNSPQLDARAALAPLADALRTATLAGLPPAALVRRSAVEERRRLAAAQRRAVRRLEVLLVMPVGLLLLPAFVLLGIVPVVVDLFSG